MPSALRSIVKRVAQKALGHENVSDFVRTRRLWLDKKIYRRPIEVAELRQRLIELGVTRGRTVWVQSSWNEFFNVPMKPSEVIDLLRELIGPEGTLAMPAFPIDQDAGKVFMVDRAPVYTGLLCEVFRRVPGVISTRVGYTGGDVPNATYRNHGTHAEGIEIVFDPAKISYRDLLEFFFQIHDPTTLNRQGNDLGMSYRSAIYYTSDDQRRVAEDTIADVDASGLWPGKAVTEVVPVGDFWEAEPEHQDYLQHYPTGYTCHFVRPGWKLPRRAA